jgi:hypothetical protein
MPISADGRFLAYSDVEPFMAANPEAARGLPKFPEVV